MLQSQIIKAERRETIDSGSTKTRQNTKQKDLRQIKII